MAAFLQAAREGADMVELDARLTRDGVLVVFHDRRLGRTARGWRAVRDLDATTLCRTSAGLWFGESFRHERIPLLMEVLERLPARIGVNIEVKTDGDRKRYPVLALRLATALRSTDRPILVSSFDHQFIRLFTTHAPTVPTGVIYMAVRDFRKRPAVMARSAGAGTFICSIAQLRRRFVVEGRARGIAVMVYGVNSRRHCRKAVLYGVNGIITNHPARMRLLVSQH